MRPAGAAWILDGQTIGHARARGAIVKERTDTDLWTVREEARGGRRGSLRCNERCAAERREQRGAQIGGEVAASQFRRPRGRDDGRAPCGAAACAATPDDRTAVGRAG